MFEQLKANPKALVSDLPEAQEWADRFFKKTVPLNPEGSFIKQVVAVIREDLNREVTPWDPYEEGYDEGPQDLLLTSWHTDEFSSTGQYSGKVVDCDNIFDDLGAALVLAADDLTHPVEAFEEAARETWVSPETQTERDDRLMKEILDTWERLSPGVRPALLVVLNHKEKTNGSNG